MPRFWRTVLLIPFLAISHHSFAAPAEQQLDEMLVKADKPALPADLPATTEAVTARQIEDSINAVTTASVLNYLPSVHVRERYIGDVNGVLVMRVNSSIASALTTVYADGLLLSNFLNNSFSTAPRWGMVSPDAIERVDVVYGPFSALYPGNSAGGVVEITTRMPSRFEARVKVDGFGERFHEYGSDDTYTGWHGSVGLGGKAGAWSFLIDADRLDNEGHPMTYTAATAAAAPAAVGTFTPVTGAFHDIDTSGKPRVVTAAAGIDHNVQDNGRFKLAYDFSPATRASYSLGIWQNRSDKRGETYLRDAAGNPVHGTGAADPYRYVRIDGLDYTAAAPGSSRTETDAFLHGLSLRSDGGGAWAWQAIASAYDTTRDETRASAGSFGATPSSAATAGTLTRADGTGWWNLDLRGEWRPGGDRSSAHQLSFGYHIDRYGLESDTYTLAPGTPWQSSAVGALNNNSRGKTETQALYLQDAWRFAPDFKLVVGGRAESWRAYDGSNFAAAANVTYLDREARDFSPKLALSWQSSPDWLWRAALAKATRFPTVGELFANVSIKDTAGNNATPAQIAGFPAPYNSAKTNDPNLQPERVHAVELSAERALDNGLVRLSLFGEDKRDALISQTDTVTLPGFVVAGIQNVDQVRTLGVEAAWQRYDLWLAGLDLSGSVTYADSTIVRDARNPGLEDTDQPRIPDWRATLVATWHASERLTWSLSYRYSGRQHNALYNTAAGRYNDVNPDVYGAVSSYSVVDAKLTYRPDRHWTAALGINNLGDEKYYVNPNPYPQRTLFASLKYDY